MVLRDVVDGHCRSWEERRQGVSPRMLRGEGASLEVEEASWVLRHGARDLKGDAEHKVAL